MKKQIILLFSFVSLIGIAFFLALPSESEEVKTDEIEFDNGMKDHIFNGNHMVVDSKMREYNELNDVESESDVIIVAEKIKQSEPIVERDELGNLLIVYTLSDVKVEKVIQGDIEPNTTISVFENEGYDDKTAMNYHIAGYEMMKTGNKYLLFLRKSKTHDNYIPSGLSYGKVPLGEEQSQLRNSINSANTEYSHELNGVYETVQEIHKDALNKYGNQLQ